MGVALEFSSQLQTANALKSHSASINPGDWFYAMGDSITISQFIPEVEKRGAARIVAHNDCMLNTKIPVLRVHDVRLQYLVDCSKYYQSLFDNFQAFGVTGTKGKTSIAYGLHKLFTLLEKSSVYIGTLGVCYGQGLHHTPNTTPGLWQLIEILQEANRRGIKQVFMEISSQGLEQHRVPCQMFDQRAFTDLSAEHLDAHETMHNYFCAKSKFFDPDYPIQNQSFQAYCLDRSSYFDELESISGQSMFSYGLKRNRNFVISKPTYYLGKSKFSLHRDSKSYDFEFPWTGFFNVENLTLILEIAISQGISVEKLLKISPRLETLPGRMQEMLGHPNGRIFVDYAHSSEALEFVCKSTRSLVNRRLILLFGCGGDRDPAKRPAMGKSASDYADLLVLTDDNPRFEDSDSIIDQILEGVPENQSYLRMPDRKKAIITAVNSLNEGDVLLICGKGHESTMTANGQTWEFDDRQIVKEALGDIRRSQAHTVKDLLKIPGTVLINQGKANGCKGFHFDSRLIKPEFAFVAMQGESQDGHFFIDSAARNGAEIIITQKITETIDEDLTVIQHPRPLEFLQMAARNYRDSHPAFFLGITGSVGKTTCKDSLVHFVGPDAYGSPGNFNNTLGLPISILNMPPSKKFGIFEMGISIPGEMSQLAYSLNPDGMIFLPVFGSHEGNFESREHLLSEKLMACKFLSERDSIFVQSVQPQEFASRLNREVISLDLKTSDLNHFGRGPAMTIGFAREIAISLGVSKENIEDRLKSLRLSPLRMETRQKGDWTFLLDCYNASPESTKMFLESIQMPAESIVVLADMLELGEQSAYQHESLLRFALNKKFNRLYLLGPMYASVWRLLSKQFSNSHCECFDQKHDLISKLQEQSPGFLGLKGSRFFALESVVDSLGEE